MYKRKENNIDKTLNLEIAREKETLHQAELTK
jgi:hypothetical protein